MKYGVDLKQTRLLENFAFAITDPEFDSASLLPYNLALGGHPFNYHSTANVNQYAFYAQDSITARNLAINIGIRVDHYDGLVSRSGVGPRLGLAYTVRKTGTVLRAAYARTFETPFNENLLLSSSTGSGGLFGGQVIPIQPGFRNQFNAGLQQAIGKHLLFDIDYFWKYTHNAYDFATLFNTTITFPVAWNNSKLDGFTGRLSTTNWKGFQAYWTFGHTRARYFFPAAGGLIPQDPPPDITVFRIDHDQVFQSTVNARYQRPKNAEWIALTYRYDSGAVVSGVSDADAALELSANQQTTIGLACGGVAATPSRPITFCNGAVTSQLLDLPASGQGNPDHNPARVKPRHTLDLGIGTDNLFHREGSVRYTASLEIANLNNVTAVYNFLSTFSGTHFLPPRTLIARIGVNF
jgi:hypothetical protein